MSNKQKQQQPKGNTHHDGPKKAGKKSGSGKRGRAPQNALPQQSDWINREVLAFNQAQAAVDEITKKLFDIDEYVDGWATTQGKITPGSKSAIAFAMLKRYYCSGVPLDTIVLGELPEYERYKYATFLAPFTDRFTRLHNALTWNKDRCSSR